MSEKGKSQEQIKNTSGNNNKNSKEDLADGDEEYKCTKEEAQSFLKLILDKISSRFVKRYLPPLESVLEDTQFYIPVEFFECKNKLPVPEQKVVFIFKIIRTLKKNCIFFQIENQSVSYPLFTSINLSYFESIIDRVLLDKYKTSQALYLQSNFESTRILNLNGETKKLYTIVDEENIFLNNKSEFYKYEGIDLNFKVPSVEDILRLIREVWKTLVANELTPLSTLIEEMKKEKEKEKEKLEQQQQDKLKKSRKEIAKKEDYEEDIKKIKEKRKEECKELKMTYDQFKLFFEYAKLNMSDENIKKLWKYTNKKKTETIEFNEFVNFAVYFIHSISAFSVAKYKHEHNNYFERRIKKCVEIMNLHFKEYDTDNNEEISFENLKKSLLKENELFTRKDIEIILRQINPDSNFQYWKFDKILRILYYENFNYQKLMDEDKIYRYLIHIFKKQDPFNTKKLNYKKMKLAFLTEDKIKFDKTEILIILNQFDINKDPDIDYYPASLIIRNIVEYLLGSEIGMQKINIMQSNELEYKDYEDDFDKYCKQVKDIFIKYDQDFDHILNKDEFTNFIKWLTPYINDETIDELFDIMDQDKDGVLTYQEFKNGFKKLMEITRIRNVMKEIKTIKDDSKADGGNKQAEEKEPEVNDEKAEEVAKEDNNEKS
jgi:Ca2+-binding EF-hand superfamily protein